MYIIYFLYHNLLFISYIEKLKIFRKTLLQSKSLNGVCQGDDSKIKFSRVIFSKEIMTKLNISDLQSNNVSICKNESGGGSDK